MDLGQPELVSCKSEVKVANTKAEVEKTVRGTPTPKQEVPRRQNRGADVRNGAMVKT